MEKMASSFASYSEGTEMDNIAGKTQHFLGQIYIDEVTETLSKYEKQIKRQYEGFKNMVELMNKTPADASKHKTHFREIYEREKGDLSLDVYYWSVMGSGRLFSRPLLKVYMGQSAGRREDMKQRCSNLAYLFRIGLSAHMAYIHVTNDTVEEFRDKWALRMTEIQTHIQNTLNQCKD